MIDTKLLLNNPFFEPFLLLEIDSYNKDISNSCEIVLIQRGLSQNIEKSLIQECQVGNFKNVKYLVEKKKANVCADYNRAVWLASSKGYLQIVKFLVENGADINAEGGSPICLAS
jgi:hypothetical protein